MTELEKIEARIAEIEDTYRGSRPGHVSADLGHLRSLRDRIIARDKLSFKLKQAKLSQVQFAAMLGVDKQTVSNWCRDVRPTPKYATIIIDKYINDGHDGQ